MKLDIDDSLFSLYLKNKNHFENKVKNGYRLDKIKEMQDMGINDDTIFLAELISVYHGWNELFSNAKNENKG